MAQNFTELKEQLKLLDRLSVPWFVCGGWAIDLFLNRVTRMHDDIEIGLFREFQSALQNDLKDFHFYWIREGKKYPWLRDQFLDLPIHEIVLERKNEKFEILLNEAKSGNWLYRRDPHITIPLVKLEYYSEIGLKSLVPEAVLLFKSKNTKLKDNHDFDTLLPFLHRDQKRWLKESLVKTSPQHPWIASL